MPSRFGLKSWMSASTAAIAVLLPCLASAALGEPEASVAVDGAQLQGSITASNQAAFRVHEIQLTSGTLVREYAGLDGSVFAISWHGPYMPNLRQLLGRYFDEYAGAAAAARHTDHRHLQVRLSDLVVESSGHMRAFSGRAYLPQAIPNGTSIGDLL